MQGRVAQASALASCYGGGAPGAPAGCSSRPGGSRGSGWRLRGGASGAEPPTPSFRTQAAGVRAIRVEAAKGVGREGRRTAYPCWGLLPREVVPARGTKARGARRGWRGAPGRFGCQPCEHAARQHEPPNPSQGRDVAVGAPRCRAPGRRHRGTWWVPEGRRGAPWGSVIGRRRWAPTPRPPPGPSLCCTRKTKKGLAKISSAPPRGAYPAGKCRQLALGSDKNSVFAIATYSDNLFAWVWIAVGF